MMNSPFLRLYSWCLRVGSRLWGWPGGQRPEAAAPECHCLSASWWRRRDSHRGRWRQGRMKDHNGVLMMQRALLAGTLGLAMAQKAAAILEGEPRDPEADRGAQGAVLRAILDAANECLGHFDDRPAGERWCDTLFHLLDLAAFAAELSGGAS